MTTTETEIGAYCKERDNILAQDDLTTFINWAQTKGIQYTTPEVADISRHKLITACINLPEPLRARSKQWLIERGYQPWDR